MGRLQEALVNRQQRKAEVLSRERELYERIQGLELFPGTLEEFQIMKQAEYKLIDVPGARKYVEGSIVEWEELGTELVPHPSVQVGPAKLEWVPRTYYSQMRVRAVELGADAVVNYTPASVGLFTITSERGLPVKRVAPQEEQQS